MLLKILYEKIQKFFQAKYFVIATHDQDGIGFTTRAYQFDRRLKVETAKTFLRTLLRLPRNCYLDVVYTDKIFVGYQSSILFRRTPTRLHSYTSETVLESYENITYLENYLVIDPLDLFIPDTN